VACYLEHGNEPSSAIKGGEFLDQFNCCQLYKKTLLHGDI
jgi:hypothetical protein